MNLATLVVTYVGVDTKMTKNCADTLSPASNLSSTTPQSPSWEFSTVISHIFALPLAFLSFHSEDSDMLDLTLKSFLQLRDQLGAQPVPGIKTH